MTEQSSKMLGGIRIGKARVNPDAASHICGIHSGNRPGNYAQSPGHLPDGRSNARRSTGVNAIHRNPIMPDEMPNLSPP